MRKRNPLLMLILLAAISLGCASCDKDQLAQDLEGYNQALAGLEAKYGPLLDDPNGLADPAYDAAAAALKKQLAGELAGLNQKYAALITNPDGSLQRAVTETERYVPATQAVALLLPSPYREIALAGLGIVTTAIGALGRRKYKRTTEELLYARQRLAQRIAASDIDTAAFTKERDTAEGEALNPETVRILGTG